MYRYQYVTRDRSARGSILSGIGRFIGGAARAVVGTVLPGGGLIANAASSVLGGGGSRTLAGTGTFTMTPRGMRQREPGVSGVVHRAIPGGKSGFMPKKRRMNAGNAKAARRAIRRIKSVRHMLQAIERELPKRTVHGHARRCS